jgi:predicted SAM-dependent methyltransferase
MPVFKISETERLISTPRVWEWQKLQMRKHRVTKELVEDWQFYRNYTSIESALKDLAEHGIRLSDEKLILDAIQDVKKLLERLGKAITDSNWSQL